MISTSLLFCLALLAEEPTFRAETRMLQVEVLADTTGLTADRFTLKVDGKTRPIKHFAQQGAERRPLALLVFFNLAPDGGMRELSKAAAIESFATAMRQLDTGDEVSVYATRDWFTGRMEEVVPLTREHDRAAGALAQAVAAEVPSDGVPSRERLMTSAIESARRVAAQRPDSHVALVYVSDGVNALDAMATRDRRALLAMLEGESNISVSALNVRMMREYAAAAAVLNPLGMAMGYRVTGTASWLASETGGISVDLESPGELAAGFASILSAYRSRYALGVQLQEGELRDGKRHRVTVKVDGLSSRQLHYRHWFLGDQR